MMHNSEIIRLINKDMKKVSGWSKRTWFFIGTVLGALITKVFLMLKRI